MNEQTPCQLASTVTKLLIKIIYTLIAQDTGMVLNDLNRELRTYIGGGALLASVRL